MIAWRHQKLHMMKSSESSVASNGILLEQQCSRETQKTVRDPTHQLMDTLIKLLNIHGIASIPIK